MLFRHFFSHRQGFASCDLTTLCVFHLSSAAVLTPTATAARGWPWCELWVYVTASVQLKAEVVDFSPAGFQPSTV